MSPMPEIHFYQEPRVQILVSFCCGGHIFAQTYSKKELDEQFCPCGPGLLQYIIIRCWRLISIQINLYRELMVYKDK